jgi:hypothetical protein
MGISKNQDFCSSSRRMDFERSGTWMWRLRTKGWSRSVYAIYRYTAPDRRNSSNAEIGQKDGF